MPDIEAILDTTSKESNIYYLGSFEVGFWKDSITLVERYGEKHCTTLLKEEAKAFAELILAKG